MAREFRISIDQLADAMKREIARKQDEVINATQIAARRGEAYLAERSMESPPADQGIFASAWRTDDQDDGAIILNDAPHAAIVEEGSRPHWPRFYPILAWVGRKRGVATHGVRPSGASSLSRRATQRRASQAAGRFKTTATPARLKSIRSPYDLSDQQIFRDNPALETCRLIALGICRKIAARGTKPRHILRDAQPELERLLQEEIAAVLGDA